MNTGFGQRRVTLSAVPPSKPVEKRSLTPRRPITTRSAVRARSTISLATMPMPSAVSARTLRCAACSAKASSSVLPRSCSTPRIFDEKSR
jgi:hypothetical protein